MVQVFVTSLPANQSLSAFSKLACDAGELQPVRKSAVLDVFLHRSCQSKSFIAKHVITCKPCSLSIKCPCHLKTRRGAAGCPRPPSCPYVVTTAPPRTGAAGCRGWAGGGGCCCLDCWEPLGDSWEPLEPVGAGWGPPALRRRGGAAPSCCTSPPRRRGGRREVRPPSGPAGLKSAGCGDTQRGWAETHTRTHKVLCERNTERHLLLTCVIDTG